MAQNRYSRDLKPIPRTMPKELRRLQEHLGVPGQTFAIHQRYRARFVLRTARRDP